VQVTSCLGRPATRVALVRATTLTLGLSVCTSTGSLGPCAQRACGCTGASTPNSVPGRRTRPRVRRAPPRHETPRRRVDRRHRRGPRGKHGRERQDRQRARARRRARHEPRRRHDEHPAASTARALEPGEAGVELGRGRGDVDPRRHLLGSGAQRGGQSRVEVVHAGASIRLRRVSVARDAGTVTEPTLTRRASRRSRPRRGRGGASCWCPSRLPRARPSRDETHQPRSGRHRPRTTCRRPLVRGSARAARPSPPPGSAGRRCSGPPRGRRGSAGPRPNARPGSR